MFIFGSVSEFQSMISQLLTNSGPKVRQNIIAEGYDGGKLLSMWWLRKKVKGATGKMNPSKACPKWPTSFSHAPLAYSYYPISLFKLG